MDFSPLPGDLNLPENGTPLFRREAMKIHDSLSRISPEELSRIMKISPALAEKTSGELQNFPDHPGKPALYSYSGTSFKHLDPLTLSREALEFAATRLSILSGLYGILSPFDLIAPYRLEMKTPPVLEGVKSLSSYWKPLITETLAEKQTASGSRVLLNLASGEYTAAVDFRKTGMKVLTVHFMDRGRNGSYRTVGMYAKQARGLLLRHILENCISNPEFLKEDSGTGYSYSDELSSDGKAVFIRD